MHRTISLLLLITLSLFANEIKQTPIDFGKKRIELTKEYIKNHYGLEVKDIKIIPKIILIHYTMMETFDESFARFKPQTLLNTRPDIVKASTLNVSTHFMVDRDGTIHQLMPLDFMARHVIGLNYSSIGIENIGGVDHKEDLTPEQLKANIFLVNYLKKKFATIEYVVGHYEYRCFEYDNELWLEKDPEYRTDKRDPGNKFMRELRKNIKGFERAPCD